MITKYLKNINYTILISILCLFVFSLFMISSATDSNLYQVNRFIKVQSLSFVIGIIVMFLIMLFDYKLLKKFDIYIYIIAIILLLLVYIPNLGIVSNGSRSWIDLGVINLQTSEITKICFIIVLASFLSKEDTNINSFKDFSISLIILLPVIILLLLQPDLGNALVFIIVYLGMIFLSGLNLKVIFAGAIGSILTLPFIYKYLKPHQQLRIDAFLNPNDPSMPGYYQVYQSKITLGSGKLFGKGIFDGVYHKYDYLPVRESDFIYAVIGEETGFLGTGLVLLVYFIFLYQLINSATRSKDKFGGLIIFGIVFMFAFQIFENIGMTIGLMPVTGITLPFLSYGGSSIVTNFIAIGLVFSIYTRRLRRTKMD